MRNYIPKQYAPVLAYTTQVNFSEYEGYNSKLNDKYVWFAHNLISRFHMINRGESQTIEINYDMMVKSIGNENNAISVLKFFKAHFITAIALGKNKDDKDVYYVPEKQSTKYYVNSALLNYTREFVQNRTFDSIKKKQDLYIADNLDYLMKKEYEYVSDSSLDISNAIEYVYECTKDWINIYNYNNTTLCTTKIPQLSEIKETLIKKFNGNVNELDLINIYSNNTTLCTTKIPPSHTFYDSTIRDPNSIITLMYYYFDVIINYRYNNYVKVSKKCNRIFHKLNSLKTELRQFINPNQNLLQLDIKNSQPTILCGVMNDLISKSEMIKWKNDINNDLYQTLIDRNNLNVTRKELKSQLFGVLFDRSYNKKKFAYNKLNGVFKNEYPEMFNKMEEIKKENHNALAIKLQLKESEIMNIIRKICFDNNYLYMTIHDAIIVDQSVSKYILRQFEIVLKSNTYSDATIVMGNL